MFIRESLWEEHKLSLMCGLSVDKINEKGGININKYLAYLALCNSATDSWPEFDIRKSIVVDDMETMVHGVVDFIDDKTYEISRREMDVPIVHTDGCGMVLPSYCKKNTMVRLPWVKGLLAVFPFDKFIQKADNQYPGIPHGIVKDIYGKDHDILREGIQVIFTKSQFKMYKFYSSWDEYIECFERNHCSAGKCNEERDYLPNAKLNYQMLQTLRDMSDDEIRTLAAETVKTISNIASDKDTMLRVFGATNENINRNGFQNSLMLYPELLSDPYTKDSLKEVKQKLVKEGRAGKLFCQGKYMFLIPDLFAFCEWLFLRNENPDGLLKDGEISCGIYQRFEKLDCLRSPHLYREHAIRKNVVNGMTRKWFTRNALYVSCHDLITKVTMNDFDGDTSLVCSDPEFVRIAERNMAEAVPLYYDMAKAGAVQISLQEIYNGMRDAWSFGNIGNISNDITKAWNSASPDISLIKLLTCEANFTVDAAKTRYMPVRPDEIDKQISTLVRVKTPHFFVYAKDKDESQVEAVSGSVVDRLEQMIPNKRLAFKSNNIGIFDYRMLLSRKLPKSYRADPMVIKLYDEVANTYRFQVSLYDDEENFGYIKYLAMKKFSETYIPDEEICDMLILYLFRDFPNKRKSLFWLCFGDIVFSNLKNNILPDSRVCEKCGGRFESDDPQRKLCDRCRNYQVVGKKLLECIDCGDHFEVDARCMKKVRCDRCQKEYRKEWERQYRRKRSGNDEAA